MYLSLRKHILSHILLTLRLSTFVCILNRLPTRFKKCKRCNIEILLLKHIYVQASAIKFGKIDIVIQSKDLLILALDILFNNSAWIQNIKSRKENHGLSLLAWIPQMFSFGTSKFAKLANTLIKSKCTNYLLDIFIFCYTLFLNHDLPSSNDNIF